MPWIASIACCPGLYPLGFPVPEPLAICEDPAMIGAVFYVMEMARGRPYANGALPDFDPDTRRGMYEQLVDTLAELHIIDPEKAELGDLSRPAIISNGRWRAERGSIAIPRPIIFPRWSG